MTKVDGRQIEFTAGRSILASWRPSAVKLPLLRKGVRRGYGGLSQPMWIYPYIGYLLDTSPKRNG